MVHSKNVKLQSIVLREYHEFNIDIMHVIISESYHSLTSYGLSNPFLVRLMLSREIYSAIYVPWKTAASRHLLATQPRTTLGGPYYKQSCPGNHICKNGAQVKTNHWIQGQISSKSL
jgi:hypothetical protein